MSDKVIDKKIVVIGGGTGTFTVLKGCRLLPFDISAIISMADDGGSTGLLRDELGVLPPGDVRQALVALSNESSILRELFNYRFEQGQLGGHQFGNLFLSALEKVTGSFDKAVIEIGKILSIRGRVIPVTTDNITLVAINKKGKKISGQHSIDEYIWSDQSPIKKLYLSPKCQLHPEAKKAILQADIVVLSPGSVFTSLIPNLLVEGMKDALNKTQATLVYVANLMTEKGQTSTYCVQDYVNLIEKYLGKNRIDYVIYNKKKPGTQLLKRYRQEMERKPVELRIKRIKSNYTLLGADLLHLRPTLPTLDDKLSRTRSLIRHDSFKLAELLFYIGMDKDFRKLNLERIDSHD